MSGPTIISTSLGWRNHLVPLAARALSTPDPLGYCPAQHEGKIFLRPYLFTSAVSPSSSAHLFEFHQLGLQVVAVEVLLDEQVWICNARARSD